MYENFLKSGRAIAPYVVPANCPIVIVADLKFINQNLSNSIKGISSCFFTIRIYSHGDMFITSLTNLKKLFNINVTIITGRLPTGPNR